MPNRDNPFGVLLEVDSKEHLFIDNNLRIMFLDFHDYITNNLKDSRQRSLALTKLEECWFWAASCAVQEGI